MVPEAIPPERLAPYGAGPEKLRRYAGLKEEYYLADFEPSDAVLHELGIDLSRPERGSDEEDARRARERAERMSN